MDTWYIPHVCARNSAVKQLRSLFSVATSCSFFEPLGPNMPVGDLRLQLLVTNEYFSIEYFSIRDIASFWRGWGMWVLFSYDVFSDNAKIALSAIPLVYI